MSETPWADSPIHKMIRDAGVDDGSSLAASDCSAYWLERLGAFQITINGQELKGWVPDFAEGGTHKTYLNAEECRQVAAAFLEVAAIMEQNRGN